MAIKAKKDKTIQERWSTIIHTEQRFARMLLQANRQQLVNLTPKQRNNMTGFIGVMMGNPTQQLLHSSDNTHGKMRLLISTGDHQSPLQQQQDSSARVNQVTQQMHIAQRLTKSQSTVVGDVTGDMNAYMLTLTRPNTHKGKLNADYKKHRERVSKLMKALKDGANNGNGVQLVDGTYLGGLVSHEVTVKHELIEKQATHGIYHPHTHIIILADADLNVRATGEVLLDKWRALNSDLSLSGDAFDFKPCFDPSAGANSRNAQISAIKEAVKYTVKPETWYRLSDTSSQYQLEVFAELYNAVKGKKLKQSHGLLELASNFLSVFEDFSNAMSFSVMDEFPDLVTQLTELVFDKNMSKHGGYMAVYGRELTLDEVLYYNYGLIEDVLVSSDLEAEIEAFFDKYADDMKTDKQKIYMDTFVSMTFERAKDDIFKRLEKFAKLEEHKNNDLKAYDIRLFSDAVKLGFYGRDRLTVEAVSHIKFVIKESEKYDQLFSKYVAPLSGPNATMDNHAMCADFRDKQGLNVSTSGYYRSGGGASYSKLVDVFVDESIENAEDYFGVRFFGDDWVDIKK